MVPQQLACDVPHRGPDWQLGQLTTCIAIMYANDFEQTLQHYIAGNMPVDGGRVCLVKSLVD